MDCGTHLQYDVLMRSSRRIAAPSANADAWAVFALLLLAFVPYLNALGGSFVYDDREQVLENPYVHSFQYDSEAQVNLGSLLTSAGDLERARAAYRSAVALDPFDSRARFGLAKLDERAGRLDEALSGYGAGLETDPGNTQAREAVLRLDAKAGVRQSVP